MPKIPLHNLFEEALHIGDMDSPEELDALIARLEKDEQLRESAAKGQKCLVCGGVHGSEVKHSPCPICGQPLFDTSGSNAVDKDGKLWHVPYFGATCRKCGQLYGKWMPPRFKISGFGSF